MCVELPLDTARLAFEDPRASCSEGGKIPIDGIDSSKSPRRAWAAVLENAAARYPDISKVQFGPNVTKRDRTAEGNPFPRDHLEKLDYQLLDTHIGSRNPATSGQSEIARSRFMEAKGFVTLTP